MPQKGVSGVNSLHLKGFEDPREDRIMPSWSVFDGRVIRARVRLAYAWVIHSLLGHVAVERAVIRYQRVIGVIGETIPRHANLERI